MKKKMQQGKLGLNKLTISSMSNSGQVKGGGSVGGLYTCTSEVYTMIPLCPSEPTISIQNMCSGGTRMTYVPC
jgi:hypothetical protein